MEADIQQDSGKTLRRFTIHALFPLSIFTEPLQLQLPETENGEVYEKLFRALREQLLSPKD